MLKKKEFIQAVAKEAKLEFKAAESAISALGTVVVSELSAGEKVTVPGIGILRPKFIEGKIRTFRNPRTGETGSKKVEDTTKVTFKPEKSLAEIVAEKATKLKK